MLKKYRVSMLFTVAILIFSFFIPYSKTVLNFNPEEGQNEVKLFLDSDNEQKLPKYFRKTSDNLDLKNKKVNLEGLSSLNISGSQQFSENGLVLIKKSIGYNIPITVVDLRQESHGFVNGIAVSWANASNNANMGLTKDQVLLDEDQKLKSIPLNKIVSFNNYPNLNILAAKVQSEKEIVELQGMSYERIPVTDGKLPTSETVEYFVNFVDSKPENVWLHFHCREGIGRTTTFMIMYDMMKNAKTVPYDDIVKRQLLLANFTSREMQDFNSKDRVTFLKNFYKWCQTRNK